ncbi:hypothetical protein [Clostridium manihotivorum]|nr:hypothetical protein [Clostridium manihotivorum]
MYKSLGELRTLHIGNLYENLSYACSEIVGTGDFYGMHNLIVEVVTIRLYHFIIKFIVSKFSMKPKNFESRFCTDVV